MRREKNIIVRVSEEEKEKIMSNVDARNSNFSEYSRHTLLNGKPIYLFQSDRKQLYGIANNLNQLVKTQHINKIAFSEKEIQSTKETLAGIQKIIKEALILIEEK